ncbi:LytTR family DNA-binding domain-containing protein [uncultured Dokdonia sp.]|uniref:LytR/AlgR family response regulator transcription factor n=1 Tax=uncultured Dokdonia sp. TaxID=575653 RepID=UPI002621B1D5|nr:LytTR family DNA-binding domain-containing protein [uncultured Dokdonia sp.]
MLELKAQRSNDILDSILLARKRYDIKKAEHYISTLENQKLKNLFLADMYFQKIGFVVENDYDLDAIKDAREQMIATYLYADILKRREIHKDSVIYRLYFNAYNKAVNAQDTLVINTLLPKINRHFLRNAKALKTYDKYLKKARQYAQDSIDLYHYYYYKAGYEMRANEAGLKEIDTTQFKILFKNGLKYAATPFLKAYMHQFKGLYLEAFLDQPEEALLYYNLAEQTYKKDSLYYSSKGIPSIAFNKAIIYHEAGDYRKSINYFKIHQEKEKNNVYRMYGYEWLYKNYDALQMNDSALYYFKKLYKEKEALSLLRHAADIREIDSKYDYNTIEAELSSITDENENLSKKVTYSLLAIGVLAVLVFIIYLSLKRFKKRSLELEGEQSEAIKQLQELKNIVTKDYIVLKDKTKVYISDLTYIKSEDHYLRVFLADGKQNFVRGKLSQISDELPPNFKRCHRSYIVNENYIKQRTVSFVVMQDATQIPVSRTYKSNL